MENEESRVEVGSFPASFGSEFRLDPATGLWALIAEGRGARPSNAEDDSATGDRDTNCAFCPGNESQTPKLVLAAVENESGEVELLEPGADPELARRPWIARVFENKYPVFRISPDSTEPPAYAEIVSGFDAPFSAIPAIGRHEVIVDTPRHIRSWSEFTDREIKWAFRIFRARLRALRNSGRFERAFVFKNVGPGAGASQRHSHCQLVGEVKLPPSAIEELKRLLVLTQTARRSGDSRSYWNAILDAELRAKERVVAASERFVVHCPFASRYPMQVEICPRFGDALEDYSDEALDELALLARRTVAALETAKRLKLPNDPSPLDYNVVMRATPNRMAPPFEELVGVARPRWVVLPSLVKKAGYEIGSGIDINPVSPETAATILREVF